MSENHQSMTDDSADDTNDGMIGALDDPRIARRYMLWTAVGLLALLAALATLRVYTNTSAAIARFVAPEFQPAFQAAFNLIVLLLSIAGITLLLRRIQAIT